MDKTYRFIAYDLGAESGRTLYGTLQDNRFDFSEVHRFPTKNDTILGIRQWDTAFIYTEIIKGLAECVRHYGSQVDGIAIDTWGVDFGLLDRDGSLLANPVHYRDNRTEGMQEAVFAQMPQEAVYRHSGLGFNRFDTLFQLMGMKQRQPALLEAADRLLLMGDLFHYLLSGHISCEYTNATTTQLIDSATGKWNDALIDHFHLPRHLFGEIIPPGTRVGTLLPDIARQVGLAETTPIFAPATHDTASVIAATPVQEAQKPWAYLSCGTWSIMGAELDHPLINAQSYALGFSSEGGVDGKICFHKTAIGLWLVQECRRIWGRQGTVPDYGALTEEAQTAPSFVSVVDVADPRLYAPDDMPEMIAQLCRETGQPVPASRGAYVRCALESMALKYRRTLKELDQVLNRKTACLHMMGGGVKNQLLCQLTADACGIPVWAGPVEAAILGNLAMQAKAAGILPSHAEARRIIRQSCSLECYEPRQTESWEKLEAHRPY